LRQPRLLQDHDSRVEIAPLNDQVLAFPTVQVDVQTPVEPTPLRAISSVRPDDMLPAGANPATTLRVFTGVYEFAGLQPETHYQITATANGQTKTLETETLPSSVPGGFGGSFNVLLVSCFHQAEDPGGLASTIVSQLSAMAKPHLSLLAGDQVYLDLPTLRNFPMTWPGWRSGEGDAELGRALCGRCAAQCLDARRP
jgi:hypothetical protein